MVEKDLRTKRMEPIAKDQPKHILTRMLMVTFGPWDRNLIRGYATLSAHELKALGTLLVSCAVVLPHLFHDQSGRAILSSGIYLFLIASFWTLVAWTARRQCPEDPSAFFSGAVLMATFLAPVTLLIPEFMPPGAQQAMALFSGAWMGLRLARIRSAVKPHDPEQ